MELPTTPITSKKILVVDDEIEARETVVHSLEVEGYFVIQSRNYQNALEILQKFYPNLILASTDILSCSMKGVEFYKIIRGDPRWVTIPFIFMVANHPNRNNDSGRNLGVEDFISKPIQREELVKIVHARLLRAAQLEIALVNRAYLETVTVLANTIESRDHYTYEHIDRVTRWARNLAEQLHFSDEMLRNLEFGARLHDIGKIIIPDYILNKRDKLTPEEWGMMRQHPVAGAKILSGISHLQGAIPYVLYHHERWNGTGYPMELSGTNIPLEGRIMALVDVYDALVTERPYHPARPEVEVVRYLQMRAGILFDPEIVKNFIDLISSRST